MLRSEGSKSLISAQGQEASGKSGSANQAEAEYQRVTNLVAILRRITLAVQVFPFIYTAILLVLFTVYSFCDGATLDIIDYAVFVSPIVIVAHIIYSRMLKMCKWHRMACALPLIPQAVDQFDLYVYHFDHNAWMVVAATIVITLSLFLFCIYKVFFTDNGRIC